MSLTSATKSNASPLRLRALGRGRASEVAADHPDVRYERVLVDALAARMVRSPMTLDVVVASNLFGDVLTDIAAALQGGMGVAASASIAPGAGVPGIFEPVHGSAPDIAGQGIANPVGAIWSASLLLEQLGEDEAARRVVQALEACLPRRDRGRAISAALRRPRRWATPLPACLSRSRKVAGQVGRTRARDAASGRERATRADDAHRRRPGGLRRRRRDRRLPQRRSRTSLDLALYDVRLESDAGALVLASLLAAHQRGVRVRLVYNVAHPGPIPVPPPPETRPEAIEALPVETRAVAGIPDLMHHKFCVRDGRDVWTGSMNWTEDSWTRQENVVVRVLGAERLAYAFTLAFEQLWDTADGARLG